MTTVISTSKYSTTLSSPRSVSLCALATLKNITKIIFHLNLVAVYKKVAKASHSPHPGVCVLDAGGAWRRLRFARKIDLKSFLAVLAS